MLFKRRNATGSTRMLTTEIKIYRLANLPSTLENTDLD